MISSQYPSSASVSLLALVLLIGFNDGQVVFPFQMDTLLEIVRRRLTVEKYLLFTQHIPVDRIAVDEME